MSLYKTLGLGNSLLDSLTIQVQALAIIFHTLVWADRRVHHNTLLGIVALLAYIGTFYQRNDGQVEMLGKGIVATIMGRNSHDGTCTITSQYIFCNIDRTLVACDGIDTISTAEHTRYGVVDHTLTLCTTLYVLDVLIYSLALFRRCNHIYQLTLRSQHKEGNTKHRISTSGEDGEIHILVGYLYLHLCTFAAANPVFLRLLDALAPLNGLQAIQQALAVSANTQTPLAHLLLLYRITTTLADTVHHLIVGQHGTQRRTPVYHRLAKVSYAVLHEQFALFLFVRGPSAFCLELLYEFLYGLCLLKLLIKV